MSGQAALTKMLVMTQDKHQRNSVVVGTPHAARRELCRPDISFAVQFCFLQVPMQCKFWLLCCDAAFGLIVSRP